MASQRVPKSSKNVIAGKKWLNVSRLNVNSPYLLLDLGLSLAKAFPIFPLLLEHMYLILIKNKYFHSPCHYSRLARSNCCERVVHISAMSTALHQNNGATVYSKS